MPAHPLDPTCIPSTTTNISSPFWHAKKYPIQEIFLAAEKGAGMCR
jgi:hypothetical protein